MGTAQEGVALFAVTPLLRRRTEKAGAFSSHLLSHSTPSRAHLPSLSTSPNSIRTLQHFLPLQPLTPCLPLPPFPSPLSPPPRPRSALTMRACIDLFALFSTAPLPSSTSTAAEPSFERWIDGTTDFEPEEHALPPLKPAVLSRPVRISKKRLSVCSTASTDSEDLSSMLDAFEESIASFPSLFPSPALPPSSPSSSSSSSSTSSPASLYFLSNSSSSTISSILSAYSVDPYSPSAPAEPVDCWRCYNDNFLPPSLLPPVPSPPRLSPQRVAELEKQRAAERHGRSSPFLR